jgi:serine/threonine protein kinase
MDASMQDVVSNQCDKRDQMATEWFEENTVLAFLHHMACGVEYLHKNHYAHRDIKLENFLVEYAGLDEVQRIVVTDFGTARVFPENADETLAQTLAGTPAYFAPEEFLAAHNPMRADCWSLGIAIFVLIVGENPTEEQLALVQHPPQDETVECRPQITRVVNGALDAHLVQRQAAWSAVRKLYEQCTVRDPHTRCSVADVVEETQDMAGMLPGLL